MFVAAAALCAETSGFTAIAAKASQARAADRLDEAIALYRKAIALNPAWAEGWWYLGTLLYDRDDYAGAAAALAGTVKLRPGDAAASIMLGLSEVKLGRASDALRDLENGRRLGFTGIPELERVALFTEGTLWLDAGEFGKAQDDLDIVARHSDPEEELIMTLGLSVLGLRPAAISGADAEARRIVRQAGWAEHFAAQGDFQAAFREYQALASQAPKFHDVQFALGRFLLTQHRDEEAVAAFRREIENTPNHLLARLGIAGIRMTTNPADGLPYAEQAVELAPKLAEAHFLLGATLLSLDQAERAIAELETAARLAPNEAKVYFQLSRAYARAGRRQEAARADAAFVRLNHQGGEADVPR